MSENEKNKNNKKKIPLKGIRTHDLHLRFPSWADLSLIKQSLKHDQAVTINNILFSDGG